MEPEESNLPDLNFVGLMEEVLWDEPLQDHQVPQENPFEEPLANGSELETATREVDSTYFTLEELESRLTVGQIMETDVIAYALYCKYATMKGFNVRIDKSAKSRDGTWVISRFYVCSCAGVKDQRGSRNRIPNYQKKSSRCLCEAKLRIGRSKGEEVWKVTKFDKEHNHELYPPDQTYLLKCARNLSGESLVFLKTMVDSGISIAKAYDVIKKISDGKENVGFIPKDAYNSISREKRKTKYENGDSNELVRFFLNKTNTESNFYWNIEVDDEKHLMNFFFRDNRSRIDYECFGDLVTFDTTYRTNMHELICAPFVGINHHNNNVMFGIGFVSDEKEETFEWLFRRFLESMDGKQPTIIFTDQCPAMMNAIKTVFPCSQHRLCQWHINQNILSNFGKLKSDKTFKSLWDKCMSFCESEEEFEATWKIMMDNYKLHETYWFNMMYNLRRSWATVFSQDIFSCGLLATSRSEGTNTTLKKAIGKAVNNASLMDCLKSYEKVQESWGSSEKVNDTLSQLHKPGILLVVESNPLIQHAAKVYTHEIFALFQIELCSTMKNKLVNQLADGSSLRKFHVESHGKSEGVRIVEYHSERNEIKCSCHKFETTGILCTHVLKVFDAVNLDTIPERYILRRWTKNAKDGFGSGVKNGQTNRGNESTFIIATSFVIIASKKWNELVMQGKFHVETRKILTEGLESIEKRMGTWFQNQKLVDLTSCDDLVVDKDDDHVNEVIIRDPLFVKPRGVTNVHRRHWDVKRKKAKNRSANTTSSIRVIRGTKRKGPSPHAIGDECPSQPSKSSKWKGPSPHAIGDECPSQSSKGTKPEGLIPQAIGDECPSQPSQEAYFPNPFHANQSDLSLLSPLAHGGTNVPPFQLLGSQSALHPFALGSNQVPLIYPMQPVKSGSMQPVTQASIMIHLILDIRSAFIQLIFWNMGIGVANL